MKYVIGLNSSGSEQIKITKAQFQKVKDAKAHLLQVQQVEDSFIMVVECLREWETELDKHAMDWLLEIGDQYSSHITAMMHLNRRLGSLLSACRFYLDTTPQVLNRLDKSKKRTTKFTKFTNKLYDDNFEYRFMEALRNFSQHHGFSILQISVPGKRVEFQGKVFGATTTAPYVRLSDLQAGKKFKQLVLVDFKKRGEKLDLKPIVRKYVECLSHLHKTFRDLFLIDYEKRQAVLRKILDDYPLPKERQWLSVVLTAINTKGIPVESVSVFSDLLEYNAKLKRRIRVPLAISSSFVTGQAADDIKP